MKRIFLLLFALGVFFAGCNKQIDNTAPPPPPPPPTQPPSVNYLKANAGSDTTICMPYGGTGDGFEAMLNGSASRDDSGKIVSYSWSEIEGSPSNPWSENLGLFSSESTIFSKDSAKVSFLLNSGGLHRFMLKVQDDHGRVDSSWVSIQINQNFDAEYDGLSWDSTSGVMTTISVKAKADLLESWPDFFNLDIDSSGVYLINFNGQCNDISSWNKLPYVPYDSIQLTDEKVFYSLVSIPPSVTQSGALFPEIYARTNSGVDFNQKVSIGFVEGYPPQSSDWKILPKKQLRHVGVN
jgi:hypothetical protein